ncbi:bifunctional DNA-binding transcriptional regulator/O6-methylguanine-DNA methyltransferase Ada [Sphingorhabdus contaminans]|jgi:AraC family transcriptional regulator of adaptative response/methylated-DNA-[protein]-cysteine methyltransferase|uniref:methylated-DNA--[protein]-cysteine S-methyltransferase n=1 Tax=Sphingorhabdus contaminans TaxID=1343899 RepID=A0A553WHB0_9SPHN|nr:bifunctional DNA-binding transcriptional regulator/O6-methylguanine-DNA methyltransferase Ada [Sphingorhabdus contaminans]TSB04062.1 bifunctional DNA-binding transcriptional regulator/O6-methylguanine-DNA methyltransferase Ada [Sphingorhabdus contaminans]
MADALAIDPDFAWRTFLARDRSYDGQFVGAVKTTGIYCKPSCPVRHPKRENVRFYATAAEAKEAGFRACLRCRPDDIARDEVAVVNALKLLAREEPISLEELAAAVGYAPHHFHRLFKRATGVTPAQYARGLRAGRAEQALASNDRVTDAIYDAGYSGPSRFYAATKGRLGMTPSAWKNGGAGAVIRWAVVETSLGTMLVAATDKGICRLSFDEDETELQRRFPAATIEQGGEALTDLVNGAIAAVENPANMPDLPLDIAGTVFQQAVWKELQRIPPGETRTYAEIAAAVGKPKAVRAAGSANGANNVAVLIPCHRVIRTDGSLGGYAYGLERKEKLLNAERKM